MGHRLAIFSLVPQSDRAQAVLGDPRNKRFVSPRLDQAGNIVMGIDIGFNANSRSPYTLATLGRCGADITIEGPSISRIQCSFELHQTSGMVMLYDRSNSQSTQVFGENVKSFLPGRPRRIVLTDRINTEFGIGRNKYDLVRFRLVWHSSPLEIPQPVKIQEETPSAKRTTDEINEMSLYHPRIHVPDENSRRRYELIGCLGQGSFGAVSKVVDVDVGDIVAVKIISKPHDFVYARIDEEKLEIFTGLKSGDLSSLIVQGMSEPSETAKVLLHQMLKALDYLACNRYIHRDVKPANILYTIIPGEGYVFQLADFGVCNFIDGATTCVGTRIFMAPEVLQNKLTQQTPKVDVWSLFVTLAVALDVAGYRRKMDLTYQECIDAAAEAAATPHFVDLKDMAAIEVQQRASAAQMLVKFYNGQGLTTPISLVLELSTLKSSTEPMNINATASACTTGFTPSDVNPPHPPIVSMAREQPMRNFSLSKAPVRRRRH